jgi:hypothetical protein
VVHGHGSKQARWDLICLSRCSEEVPRPMAYGIANKVEDSSPQTLEHVVRVRRGEHDVTSVWLPRV